MGLLSTDGYIRRNGIKMSKRIGRSFWGDTYDYRTVYDLEEAADMNQNEGWYFANYQDVFCNLTLNLYRDLKRMEDK